MSSLVLFSKVKSQYPASVTMSIVINDTSKHTKLMRRKSHLVAYCTVCKSKKQGIKKKQ